jgi:hypothetical protein
MAVLHDVFTKKMNSYQRRSYKKRGLRDSANIVVCSLASQFLSFSLLFFPLHEIVVANKHRNG